MIILNIYLPLLADAHLKVAPRLLWANACCDIFASFLQGVEGARFRCEYII